MHRAYFWLLALSQESGNRSEVHLGSTGIDDSALLMLGESWIAMADGQFVTVLKRPGAS